MYITMQTCYVHAGERTGRDFLPPSTLHIFPSDIPYIDVLAHRYET